MRCKRCDYPLWNLRDRQCPECGLGFVPSGYEFALNSVRFCCPHCGKGYYGTGASGHLWPRVFDCVGCGSRVDMDEMVLEPTAGVDERATVPERNPWLDPDKGWVKRWFGTAVRGFGTPGWLMRTTPVDSDSSRAWGFALSSFLMGSLLVLVPVLVVGLVATLAGGGGMGGMLGVFLLMGLGVGVATAVLLGVWVVTAHVMLRLTGEMAGGIGRTSQAFCYTCAPHLMTFVPCLGWYFGWVGTIWWVVVAGIALASAQKVSGLRAAIAVCLLPAVVCVGTVSWVGWNIASSFSMAGGFSAFGGSGYQTVEEFAGLFESSRQRGAWPAHVAEGLVDGSVWPSDFVAFDSMTYTEDCVVDGIDLDTWTGLSDAEQRAAAANAAAALPDGLVAYRVGDMVFTYPGIDPSAQPTGLWLVVESWDPGVAGQGREPWLVVLEDDLSTRYITTSRFATDLAEQNALRAQRGLPPLPDPSTVLQGSPAVASDPG